MVKLWPFKPQAELLNPPAPVAQVVTSKLVKLGAKSSQAGAPAEVIIRRRRRSRSASGTPTESWEMVRARGHHDEVLNLTGAPHSRV